MAEETPQIKWEGKSIVELKGPTADQIWPLLEDFCNINKWFPSIDVCNHVDGELGKPGLTRYCASKTLSTYGSYDEAEVRWVKERLLMINPTEKCLSYEVLENNSGFKSYVATMKVLEINGSDAGENGCKIEWSFIADPVEGWTLEDFSSFINFCLQSMGKNMEQDVLSG
ncbi:PREDICTED: lachrymatory-factor synthase [Populus euphratica]|uniref:Lachrymatory-factor synthase n=1 Tax=Populus euphratica TaxID=75702 RepID=A0AAJ6TZ60_POPEU|nr:PREDICTED: lachrymatory-factor synthase [Populus euphratica]